MADDVERKVIAIIAEQALMDPGDVEGEMTLEDLGIEIRDGDRRGDADEDGDEDGRRDPAADGERTGRSASLLP